MVISSIYGEYSRGWKTLKPKGTTKGKPWIDIAKSSGFFFGFYKLKPIKETVSISGMIDGWMIFLSSENFPDLFAISMKGKPL